MIHYGCTHYPSSKLLSLSSRMGLPPLVPRPGPMSRVISSHRVSRGREWTWRVAPRRFKVWAGDDINSYPERRCRLRRRGLLATVDARALPAPTAATETARQVAAAAASSGAVAGAGGGGHCSNDSQPGRGPHRSILARRSSWWRKQPYWRTPARHG